MDGKFKPSIKRRFNFDPIAIVVSILGPLILLFSTAAFIMVYLQIDPLVYFIPVEQQGNWLIIFIRCIFVPLYGFLWINISTLA